MVSLPFSDHCEPLVDSMDELTFLLDYLQADMDHQDWKYLEVRPVTGNMNSLAMVGGFRVARHYYLHRLDIRPDADNIFRSLNKKSIQRRIIRAERSGLVCECGRSAKLLKDFYHLMLLTRSRHHLPPQPRTWFENLASSMDNLLEIRVAYKAGVPISAILTLRFRDVVYYKYGCSDTRFKSLGATSLLLWQALQDSKMTDATVLDLGRSDTDNVGLIEFKNHWVRDYTQIMYWRYPAPESVATNEDWKLRMVKHACAKLPQRLLEITGNLLYRHIG
jgi:lipid II:glycine glycyltransferase (peptidoglycan interpeptide bridge formation enzyme)